MECMHRLSVFCQAFGMKCKELVMRLIVKYNAVRGGAGSGVNDDGSMLDGLLMGER